MRQFDDHHPNRVSASSAVYATPFDRSLVATASAERMMRMTHDEHILDIATWVDLPVFHAP